MGKEETNTQKTESPEEVKERWLKDKLKRESLAFRKEFAGKMLNLATSGFGLVAALAWNELVRELVREYIQPVLGESSGLISLLIYAVLVTFLAVLVTYNLSKLAEKKD